MPSLPDAVATGDLSGDILRGAGQIAEYLFGDDRGGRRRVYHLIGEVKEKDRLPVFRLGSMVCARRSTLRGWIAEQERKAAAA